MFVDGKSLNLESVKEGMAWSYREYKRPNVIDELEAEAREAKVGLWGADEKPQAPWEFRKERK